MELQVTQENLNRALGSVARVANSRSTLPVLSNVLVKTVDKRLSIAATNLDIAITHYIGAKVTKEGLLTLPARLMQDFVSSLPASTISLSQEDNKLHIQTDQYASTINGVAADEYPVMPSISEGTEWRVAAQTLKKGLQQVVFAASADETRPVLTGVYVHTDGGELFVAATDSYRLAEKTLTKTKETINLLVPATAMHEVVRIIGDLQDDITIVHDNQQVLFKIGDVELVTRLIEGNYPDYRKLIPAEFETTATLKRAELINITKVSSLFARETAGSLTLKASEKDAQVSIHSIASQLGENTASAEAEVTGQGDITLNSRYLLDGLGALGGEQVCLSFNGKLEPCVLRDTSDTGYTHIIMPLKS